MKTLINDGLRFVCTNDAELWRARTLLTKEPGTIALLDELQSGEVFYDIGANVGCYTLYAAKTVGPTGRVYAFEPHAGNRQALMRNIVANGFQDRVAVVACPLSDGQKYSYFKADGESGTSDHQVQEIRPSCGELVWTTTIDSLIAHGLLEFAHVVKVDVDGHEPAILRGMEAYLTSPMAPRAIQVERATSDSVMAPFLIHHGYHLQRMHYTKQGREAIDAGADVTQVVGNGVYTKAAAA